MKKRSKQVELSIFNAINFFDQSYIHEEKEQLSELIVQIKIIDFKNAGSDLVGCIVTVIKFSNTIIKFIKLSKKQ